MITKNEIQSTLISPTAKDFFQIWNDLLEVSSKISERWDPSTTNESDPGIVLLKVLTALADKLNYNIDKNILEAYMPSAAQEESMRKLCDMLGYNMKYYQSATTDVTISYTGSAQDWQDSNISGIAPLILPRFTQITNIDADIIYTTTERAVFTRANSVATVPCIEGTLHFCEEDNDGIVTLNNIDDNFRYYLPQTYIAENGLFVYNVSDGVWSTQWEQVGNLNAHPLKSPIYKFGYDSKKFLPYIQFPEDISALIADGLRIGYIVTSGINGNVSAKTLTTFTTPSEWALSDSTEAQSNSYNKTGIEHTAEEFKCSNESASTNGANRESLNSAYNGFKKTIGTFDTLVTCRDYMNKIYQLTKSDTDTTPLVSNSIVSDIRDDINRAMTICSFDDYGIKYVDYSHSAGKKGKTDYSIATSYNGDMTASEVAHLFQPTSEILDKTLTVVQSHTGSLSGDILTYWRCCTDNAHQGQYQWCKLPNGISEPQMNHFDLILYPFKTVQGLNTKNEYDNSFKYDDSNYRDIEYSLREYKTISHKLNLPEDEEIVCIKNYLRLNAKITTMNKVDKIEWQVILNNIKTAIYKTFNLRQLDFSEEIPFDDILDIIQSADANIKNVSLEEPTLYTTVLTKNNKEYFITYDADTVGDDIEKQNKEIIKKFTPAERADYKSADDQTAFINEKKNTAKKLYNDLVLRNILAGRIELFNYNQDFSAEVNETPIEDQPLIYPTINDNPITTIKPTFDLDTAIQSTDTDSYTLKENQIIQFRSPNFRTIKTYPAYVNYYLKLNNSVTEPPIIADFKSLYVLLTQPDDTLYKLALQETDTEANNTNLNIETLTYNNTAKFNELTSIYTILFEKDGATFKRTEDSVQTINSVDMIVGPDHQTPISGEKTYYTIKLVPETFFYWTSWFTDKAGTNGIAADCDGLYRADQNNSYVPGYLIDANHTKYILVNKLNTQPAKPLSSLFVPAGTAGKGKDAVAAKIAANTEYQLQPGEVLYINYTDANTSAAEMGENDTAATLKTTSTVINETYEGNKGIIIKPNFDLENSEIKAQTTSYAKKTGFIFPDSSIPGMFSIGANEQIEIREPVVVYIYDETNTSESGPSPIYVYFNLKNETPDNQGRICLFDHDDESYTLKEGEYFWYTDKNKQTLTYCGPGTELENHVGMGIAKRDSNTKVTTEDILEQGLSIVPWITIPGLYMIKPNDESAGGKYIKWKEYQYITLTSEDTLLELDPIEGHKINPPPGYTEEFVPCTSAKYQFKDATSPEELPQFNISGITWAVKTKLEVNSSPATGQLLHVGDSIQLLDADNTEITTISGSASTNTTFKTNYMISSTLDNISTVYNTYNEEGELESLNNFKVKAFNQESLNITVDDNEPIPVLLNDTQQYYTSIPFSYIPDNYSSNNPYFTLYCTIPDSDNQFGLIMFYYKTENSIVDPQATPRIEIWTEDSQSAQQAEIYNNSSNERIDKFKHGINVIKISETCTIKILPASGIQSKDDIIIFSPLDIIDINQIEPTEDPLPNESAPTDRGINLDILKYYVTDSYFYHNDPAGQLLADIREADEEHIFYYNAIIDNSTKLDLNTDAGETMQTERIWYDYNNVNNKFVVSEIDSDYLDTGITIARTSSK